MFTSSHTALTHHGDHNVENKEFVTVDYIGSMPGDETGRVRVIMNNDASATGMGSTMYFIGLQANGSRFTDLRGGESFSEPGSTGMLDWGAFTTRNDTGSGWRRGLDALVGGQHRSVCMHRTLGSDPNQVGESRSDGSPCRQVKTDGQHRVCRKTCLLVLIGGCDKLLSRSFKCCEQAPECSSTKPHANWGSSSKYWRASLLRRREAGRVFRSLRINETPRRMSASTLTSAWSTSTAHRKAALPSVQGLYLTRPAGWYMFTSS